MADVHPSPALPSWHAPTASVDGEPRWPELFIVGGPRCGTIALRDMLAAHPDVYFPDIPEAHFFGTDLARYRLDGLTPRTYLSLFTSRAGQRYAGDTSPYALYSKDAAAFIHERSPDARVLVVIRDIVDMLHSVHAAFVANGAERELDLERALERESARAPGDGMLPLPAYAPLAEFAAGIARYQKELGEDRVIVLSFDELVREPYRVYVDICRRLDLVPQPSIPDGVAWPSTQPRDNLMRRFWYDALPHATRQRLKRLLPLDDPRAFRLYAALRFRFARLTTRPAARPPLDPAVRARIAARFEGQERAAKTALDAARRPDRRTTR